MTALFDRKSTAAILIEAQRGAMKKPPSAPGGLRKLNANSGHSIRRSASEGGNRFHKSAHGAEVVPGRSSVERFIKSFFVLVPRDVSLHRQPSMAHRPVGRDFISLTN